MRVNPWPIIRTIVKEAITHAKIYLRLKINFPKVDFGDRSLTSLLPPHKRALRTIIATRLLHESESGRITLPATGEIAISEFKYKTTGGRNWETVRGSYGWADLNCETENEIKRAAITVSAFTFAGKEIKLSPPLEMEIVFQR